MMDGLLARVRPRLGPLVARTLAPLRRHPVTAFFTLSYAITWPGFWLEAAGISIGTILGYFGPAIAAVVVAFLVSGRSGPAELLGRLFHWRVSVRWYLVALLLPAGLVLLPVAIAYLAGGAPQQAGLEQMAGLAPQLALVLVGGSLYGTAIAAGEELGWRGYALPGLLDRHSPLVASLVIGIVWGLWHLPLSFLYPVSGQSLGDAILYGLAVDFAAVIYTWLFLHTAGSVLLASLFHAVYDVCLVVLGPLATATLGIGSIFRLHILVMACVALLLVLARPRLWGRPLPAGGAPPLEEGNP
jgi:membrane protease YdiL (CAAX protease family)